MDEARDLTLILTRTADGAGPFHPPPVQEITRRRRDQSRSRTTLAVVVSAVTLIAVALAVALVGRSGPGPVADRTPRPTRQPSTAPPVPVAALQGYRWSEMPPAPIDHRSFVASAWTGQQLIVWGGQASSNTLRNDGATYNPATRAWAKLPASPLSPRSGALSAWAAGKFVVWGGYDSVDGHRADDGASYDPRTQTWSRLPAAPVPAYETAQLVATGSYVVLLSSSLVGDSAERRDLAVAVYDPAHNTWRSLRALTQPAGRQIFGISAVGAGTDVLVWVEWFRTTTLSASSGSTSTTSGIDSYRLDATTGRWTTTNLSPDQGRGADQPLWTGTQVLFPQEQFYCGPCSHPISLDNPGVAIDAKTGGRTVIPAGPISGSNGSYVWTGGALLGVNLTTEGSGMKPGDTVAWDPTTGKWTRLRSAPFSGDASSAVVVWTGKALLIWGIGPTRGKPGAPDRGFAFAPA